MCNEARSRSAVRGLPPARRARDRGGPAELKPTGGRGLTEVHGIKVGHHTLTERPTGCTVILVDGDGVPGGVSQRGGAPGTRETDLLDPVNMVDRVNADRRCPAAAPTGSTRRRASCAGSRSATSAGGSASGVVPIVPAAILLDLGFGGNPKIRPTADCGYKAAQAATDWTGRRRQRRRRRRRDGRQDGRRGGAMKGGLGSAAITLPNGLVVAAIVAVNAVGDIIDPETGQVVAGARTEDGKALADARKLLRSGALDRRPPPRAGENTTIGLVATNARLTKTELNARA